MAKVKILLLFMILEMAFFWLGGDCLAEEIPFGINNPYDDTATKEKASLIKQYMNDLRVKWVNANIGSSQSDRLRF